MIAKDAEPPSVVITNWPAPAELAGAIQVICKAELIVGVTATPLKVTLTMWTKCFPTMTTDVPPAIGKLLLGVTEVIVGALTIVKVNAPR